MLIRSYTVFSGYLGKPCPTYSELTTAKMDISKDLVKAWANLDSLTVTESRTWLAMTRTCKLRNDGTSKLQMGYS